MRNFAQSLLNPMTFLKSISINDVFLYFVNAYEKTIDDVPVCGYATSNGTR